MATNPNYLVLIQQYGSAGTGSPVLSVTAPVPESVQFDLSATYDPLLPQGFTKNGALNGAAAAMGMRLAVQALTAQLWTGSTTGDLNLQLEFMTENDPINDVRQPVLNLMKLVTPTIAPIGMLQSPGPQLDFSQLIPIAKDAGSDALSSVGSVLNAVKTAAGNVISGAYHQIMGDTPAVGQMSNANTNTTDANGTAAPAALQQNPQLGTAAYWKNQVSNRISIRIGNYLFFDNVVVTHVSNQFTSTFDAVTGLPHHIIVGISFRPMFTLAAQDLDNVFLNPTGGTTSGNNAFGFSIPDAVANAGKNVASQFGLSNVFGYTGK